MTVVPDLSHLAVFITGAGRGLGASMAERLGNHGAYVAVVDVDAATAEGVAERIRLAGGRAEHYATDVARRTEVMEAAAQFSTKAGRIDAVINNAMWLHYEPVEKIDEEMLARTTAIGIHGSVWGAQALLAHYDAKRGGHLINMASPVAERGFANTAAYSLVKGALVTLTKTLAAELGPKNIRVNALAPGSVPTPGALQLNDKSEYERRARTIPAAALGSEDDNANACVFLLSEQASFVHGEMLHVDGGIAAAG